MSENNYKFIIISTRSTYVIMSFGIKSISQVPLINREINIEIRNNQLIKDE